jgi:hypothetical protein
MLKLEEALVHECACPISKLWHYVELAVITTAAMKVEIQFTVRERPVLTLYKSKTKQSGISFRACRLQANFM